MTKKSDRPDYSKPTDFQEFKRRFLSRQGRTRECKQIPQRMPQEQAA